MKNRLVTSFYFYQRACWYLSVAVSEARKPLVLWNETALVTIFLSTVLGYKPPIFYILGVYVAMCIVGVIVGKVLVKTGVVAYNQKLNNKQSPELLEILDKVNKLLNDSGN